MSWFRVDADLVDHPKVFRLAELLNDPLSGWYYVRLLAWTSRYAARGRPRDGARTAIEHACGWRGEPGALLAAFVQVGLVDELEGQEDGATLEVHDWWEIQRQYVVKAEKDAERKRNERSRRAAVTRSGAVTSRGQSTDGHADSPPDVTRDGARTRRDETRRDETVKSLAGEAPAASGELFESVPPQVSSTSTSPPPKSKPAKPPKLEKPTDPRHKPLLEAMVIIFGETRGAPPGAVNGAWAKGVSDLLALADPFEVVRRWRLALVSKYPTVVTPLELARHWDHWTGEVETEGRRIDPNQGILR
jgi:hypothetical protein